MRVQFFHTCTMEAETGEFSLDIYQVKKAVQALQAYLKSTSSQNLLLNETQQICLLLTLWKVPKQDQTIRISLPHGLRTESAEVCLFTRDEPNMTADQTERFYKKLLTQRGLRNIPEVIPFKVLKTEYKPFEAKRRLLGNFDLFLADARIYRRLPSHIGKHFYERKKAPLSVDLESNHLVKDIERLVQGTTLSVTKKGSCCMVRVAHTGMTADKIVENTVTAVNTISSKLRMKGKSIKVIHLKSHTSVALPIYTSDLSHLNLLEEELRKARLAKGAQKIKKKNTKKTSLKTKNMDKTSLKKKTSDNKDEEGKKVEHEEEDEEIPQLIPIESPNKKTKLEALSKTGSKKTPKLNTGDRNLKPRQGQKKISKKAPKAQVQKKKKVTSV
ncbi:ribosomal L1 domain-containing protein 1 [Colossoma macropomum]|uniref:ribosomal L1 domain-containing protein 1 n=1 Tax=Colossoma macropomum TaxID=42526 RepID=UPI001863B97E|nr:ribosomal L1 domain-containing protein 1 [Colossoma macropomum]